MNAIKVYNLVCKLIPHITFELLKENKDETVFDANIVAKDYFDDAVYTKIIVYSTGAIHVTFTFDELEPTMESFMLINAFNLNSSWLSACIFVNKDGETFLRLHHGSPSSKNEKAAAQTISNCLDELLSEDVLEYLIPLTKLTVGEDDEEEAPLQ